MNSTKAISNHRSLIWQHSGEPTCLQIIFNWIVKESALQSHSILDSFHCTRAQETTQLCKPHLRRESRYEVAGESQISLVELSIEHLVLDVRWVDRAANQCSQFHDRCQTCLANDQWTSTVSWPISDAFYRWNECFLLYASFDSSISPSLNHPLHQRQTVTLVNNNMPSLTS